MGGRRVRQVRVLVQKGGYVPRPLAAVLKKPGRLLAGLYRCGGLVLVLAAWLSLWTRVRWEAWGVITYLWTVVAGSDQPWWELCLLDLICLSG